MEHQDFMERDYDHRAGYKHHQTRKYLTSMQEGLMAICEREHLHQVDLLSPAADKVTDREYRLNQRRQNAAECDVPASGSQTDNTKPFQSQKKYLQEAIREVSSYAQSAEQFGDDLKKNYGIQFKISRGRFSYLHPDRQKYITGRTLGNDYTECYLIPLFEGNKRSGRTRDDSVITGEEFWKEVESHKEERLRLASAYDPSYDYIKDPMAALYFRTKLRLVVDLQTCAKAQASRAYARKVKISNLQQMAQTICFVQEHGIDGRLEIEDLIEQKEKLLYGKDPNNPWVKQLRRECKDLITIKANVDAILKAEWEHTRSRETAQDLR